MKIAIISDIHGNLEALKSAFEDIESKNINKIFCLGDIIANGSHPKECIDLIREKCEIGYDPLKDEAIILSTLE